MTPEQLKVAQDTKAFHAEKFGFANVDFHQGFIERLDEPVPKHRAEQLAAAAVWQPKPLSRTFCHAENHWLGGGSCSGVLR